MKFTVTLLGASLMTVAASPVLAASKNPFSSEFWHLDNTDMIVLIAFLIFIGILIKFKVPAMLTGLLDARAAGIRADLDEAKALREEARTLLAAAERKQREVQTQVDRITETAKKEATNAAAQAKDDIASSVTRRLAAAKDQIASAQSAAIRDVRNQSVAVAIAAAQDVIAKQTTGADASKMIDDAIVEVGAKLH